MAVKGKGQVPGPDVDDNLQLGLEEEVQLATEPRVKRQAKQAENNAQGVALIWTQLKNLTTFF